MIRLPKLALPDATGDALRALQASVDSQPSYPEKVSEGKRAFKKANRNTNPVFRVVREKLYELAGKTGRCAYCEDSLCDEVEHVAPKDLYPNQVFTWENYLYACGPCNGSNKGSQWKICADGSGALVDVTRKRNAPIVAPIAGVALFINPRTEDPMDYLELDIIGGTFIFVPKHGVTGLERERALYTRKLVGLNTRAGMVENRKQAYVSFRSNLESFDREKAPGGSAAKRAELEHTIRNASHRSVWKEMQRQNVALTELTPLFMRNPEALTW